jgi:hypothetical protein
MLDTAADTHTRFEQLETPDVVRSFAAPARTFESQLKARALLAVFCRDEILEARMSPDVQEILGILARAVAARPSPRRRNRTPTGGRS